MKRRDGSSFPRGLPDRDNKPRLNGVPKGLPPTKRHAGAIFIRALALKPSHANIPASSPPCDICSLRAARSPLLFDHACPTMSPMGLTGSDTLLGGGSSQEEPAAMAKFLSFLSHDLRGGLNGAVLMIEVLKRQLSHDPKLESAVQDLDVVRRSILDTVATMERFLHAERLRLGYFQVKNAAIDVHELLRDIQRSTNYALKERRMTLEQQVDPHELMITSDRQLLIMVLTNLVSNAIKYGRNGSVRVSVQGANSAPEGVACRFAVQDQGPGLAPEKAAELFRPFTRGETYGQKGMGLGLYIARQASDLLGARLWVDSQPGHGCTIFLDLKTA
jgi:signal transduction histidine kinase